MTNSAIPRTADGSLPFDPNEFRRGVIVRLSRRWSRRAVFKKRWTAALPFFAAALAAIAAATHWADQVMPVATALAHPARDRLYPMHKNQRIGVTVRILGPFVDSAAPHEDVVSHIFQYNDCAAITDYVFTGTGPSLIHPWASRVSVQITCFPAGRVQVTLVGNTGSPTQVYNGSPGDGVQAVFPGIEASYNRGVVSAYLFNFDERGLLK